MLALLHGECPDYFPPFALSPGCHGSGRGGGGGVTLWGRGEEGVVEAEAAVLASLNTSGWGVGRPPQVYY